MILESAVPIPVISQLTFLGTLCVCVFVCVCVCVVGVPSSFLVSVLCVSSSCLCVGGFYLGFCPSNLMISN